MIPATRSPKRPASPPHAIDMPSPKKPEPETRTAEDTSVSREAATFTLEFLPDTCLPHRQELERLNDVIHSDIKEEVLGRGIEVQNVHRVLLALDKHCDFLEARPHWRRALFGDTRALDTVLQMAREAYQRGDYSRFMLLKALQRSPQAAVKTPSASGTSVSSQVAAEGWNAPFIGTAHVALARNIQDMFRNAVRDLYNREYMTHVCITQSSGSGKSRLIDKVAETIFTIPFNVREARACAPGDAVGGAEWPRAGDGIRDLLVDWTRHAREGEMRLYARYLCFFAAVFEEVREQVERYMPPPGSEDMASAWRAHLAEKGSEHRNDLYARVVNSDTIRNAKELPPNVDSETVRGLQKTARGAMEQLLGRVCATETASGTAKNIRVLISFDEAHVLANRLTGPDGSPSQDGKTALDVLFTVLDDFRDLGLFGVFMSTQAHLENIDFQASPAPFSRGARRLALPPYAHAPITETPFDCFGDRRIVPSRLRTEDVCDVAFMACFGRPMWRSLMLPSCDEVLANASGTPHDPSTSHQPSYDRRDLLRLAQAKLVSRPNRDLERERSAFSRAAQVAVLDVRIMLPFEPRSASAQRLQMELVARHMRTVFSIPQHRQCVRSGYPSEPILAEAAARQLHRWRIPSTTALVVVGDEPLGYPGPKEPEPKPELEPAAVILNESIDDGLLDRERGEVGEAVGRLLLILARDRAALTANSASPKTELPLFSRAIPVNAFIEALFSPAIARVVLDSKPDNLPSASPEVTTFAEAFKDAVVNFTHFARWDADDDDGSVPDVNAAVGCFVRSMALVCRKNALKVGAFIPVLLDQSAHLRPEVMTGILIRFNGKQSQGRGAGARAACPIDEEDVGLFDPDPTPADGQTAPPRRPYVTLVMELGVPDPPSSSSHTDTGPADVNSSEVRVPVDVGQPPIWVSDEDEGLVETVQHPRYSITAYGCSHSVYGVIGEHDSGLYEQMIRKGDPLREHPQQDAGSLDLVRMLKPAFSTEDASWDWMAKDDRNLGVQ